MPPSCPQHLYVARSPLGMEPGPESGEAPGRERRISWPFVRCRPSSDIIWDPFIDSVGGWTSLVEHCDRDGTLIPVETKGLPLRERDGTVAHAS